jgi:hypothetical protein
MMATCPDVSKCPPLMRYTEGCCEKCKMEPLSQHNCLAESLAESVTIELIQTQIPPHGNCKNVNAVRGITQCSGTCRSGTKFDPCKSLKLDCKVFQLKFNSFRLVYIFSDFASTQRVRLLFCEWREGTSCRTRLRR